MVRSPLPRRGRDSRRALRGWLWPHAALVAPALAFFAPALFFGRVLYLRDIGLYFYPHKALIAAALHQGRLPQWNPFEFGGLPLLADPNFNLFHPLSLLTWLLPLPLGFTLFVFACALSAAYGARTLARVLGASEQGAVIAGLAFAWSGPFLSMMESVPCTAPAFLPWMCAAGALLGQAATSGQQRRDQAPARAKELRAAAGSAICAALIFVSGMPELGACALGLSLLLAIACAGGGRRLRALWLGIASIVLGAGLAAVQLWPTAAFLRRSSRAAGFAWAQAAAYSLHPLRLFEIAVPYFSGEIDAPGTRQWLLDPGSHTPYVQEIYAGAVVLLLVLAGLRQKSWPRRWLAIACAVLLLLALGSHTPLFALARALLPPLRVVRYPEKLIEPVALGWAVFAGAGWDRLRLWSERTSPPEPVRARTALRAALLLLGLAGIALLLALWPGSFAAQLGAARASCLRATALPGTATEALLCALALLLIALRARRTLAPRALLAGLAALFALDLALPAARMDYTVPAAELVSPSPLVKLLRELPGPPFGTSRTSVQATGLSAAQVDALFDPAWPRPRKLFALRHAALWDANAAVDGVYEDRGYSGFTDGALQKLYGAGKGRAALDLLSVRYGIEFGAGAPFYASLGFLPEFSVLNGELRVFRNPTPREKLRLVGTVLAGPAHGLLPHCAGDAEAIWLSTADAATLANGQHALESCPSQGASAALGSVRLVRYQPERVQAEVNAAAPALLLLADTWDAGWSARLDGVSAPSLAADGALRAVAVPAGPHRVEWSYRAPGLAGGAIVSALSLCLLLGLFWFLRRA